MKVIGNRLVIVNQDVGYLFVDLANAGLRQYDEVTLITGSVVELGSRLDERVKVRPMVRYRRRSVVSRLISWLIGFVQLVWMLRWHYRADEILVSSNPPLNTLLSLLLPNKVGLYVLDLYPEALHKTGMLSVRNPIVRVWARLNRLAYGRFSSVWALTPSMKTVVEQQYNVKVRFAPAWASELVDDVDRSFLDRERVADSWVVLYSGNLGREHEIECLLDCAARLSDCSGLLFVIAGDGWSRARLRDRIIREHLSNVRLMGKLPGTEFSTLLSHARIGVVSQSLRTADVCIPSKTFNLLASGLPILGIGKIDSDFGHLIGSTGSGKVFFPNQIGDMSSFVRSCWQDEEIRRGFELRSLRAADAFKRSNADCVMRQFVAGDSDG